MSVYYVYIYLDPTKSGNFYYDDLFFKYQPFYVGKGKGQRLHEHLKGKGNNFLKNKVIKSLIKNGLKPIIIKLYENLGESQALSIEEDVIRKMGRIVTQTGVLTNLTNGGQGHSGLIQSEETKLKRVKSLKESSFYETVRGSEFRNTMSFLIKERYKNPEARQKLSQSKLGELNPMFGKSTSEKQKKAVRKAHSEGRIKLSEEGRKKLIEKNQNRKGKKNNKIRFDVKIYKLTAPSGIEYKIDGAVKLQTFCKDNILQYHTLKNNIGFKIDETLIKRKNTFGKNTLNWKIEKYE